MTPAAYTQFLVDLLAEESVVFFNPPSVQRAADRGTIIAWPNQRPLGAQRQIIESTVQEYIADVRENNYTCLLPNAAIIQIEYKLRDGVVQYHRYCYMPAPFDITEQVSPEEIENLIDLASNLASRDIRLRAKLRFEFDASQVMADHPRSHLHIHFPECRVPVKSYIGVHSFFRFVYRHFCYDRFSASRTLAARRDDSGNDLLSPEERLDAHIFWNV
jgi:hypothetical protein